jgi:hypothetical protein
MTIAAQQKLTFDQFLDQYPEDGRYELVEGRCLRCSKTNQVRTSEPERDSILKFY